MTLRLLVGQRGAFALTGAWDDLWGGGDTHARAIGRSLIGLSHPESARHNYPKMPTFTVPMSFFRAGSGRDSGDGCRNDIFVVAFHRPIGTLTMSVSWYTLI